MNDYPVTNINQEKKIGIERRLRGEIVISHDYDFEIINHLTAVLGFDVETERVQTSMYDGELHIKVYENVKREPLDKKKYY